MCVFHHNILLQHNSNTKYSSIKSIVINFKLVSSMYWMGGQNESGHFVFERFFFYLSVCFVLFGWKLENVWCI